MKVDELIEKLAAITSSEDAETLLKIKLSTCAYNDDDLRKLGNSEVLKRNLNLKYIFNKHVEFNYELSSKLDPNSRPWWQQLLKALGAGWY